MARGNLSYDAPAVQDRNKPRIHGHIQLSPNVDRQIKDVVRIYI